MSGFDGSEEELPTLAFGGIPLYVGHVEWLETEPTTTRPHRHPHPELAVSIGEATLVKDFEEHAVVAVTATLIEAGVVHEWRRNGDLELWVIGLTAVTGDTGSAVLETLSKSGPVAIPRGEVDDVTAMLRMAKRRFEEQPTTPGPAAAVVRALLEQLAGWTPRDPDHTAPEDIVTRFCFAVASDPHQRTVADVAASLGVSAGHLATRVKHRTGRTPKEIMRARTVLESKRLLANTSDSAAAIALQLGFSDPSQFGRYFRSAVGVTPGDFRRSVRSEDVPVEEPQAVALVEAEIGSA